MLDEECLLAFAERFYGYGDLRAPVWFIGMEEAGGNRENIAKRLRTWDARGRHHVEDMAGYHEAMDIVNLTSDRPKLQSTWSKLIYAQLSFLGESVSQDDARRFQGATWGRHGSSTCLLELMPLPKRSSNHWNYHEWTDAPELWSRGLYFAHFAARRAAALRALVAEWKPKAVVFYGKTAVYAAHWPWIAGTRDLIETENTSNPIFANAGGVTYAVMPHPVAHGTTNETWITLGREIAQRVS